MAQRSIFVKQENKKFYLIINDEDPKKIDIIDKRAATWLCGLYKVQMAMKYMGHTNADIASATLRYSNREDIGNMWTHYVLDFTENL